VRLLAEPEQARTEEQEAMIQNMVELGFPRTDCIEALRAAYGNPDRAIQYLQAGELPSDPEGQVSPEVEHLRQVLIQNPGALVNIIDQFASQWTPEQVAGVRRDPSALVRHLGLDPDSFPPGLFEQIRNGTAQPLPESVLAQPQPAARVAQQPRGVYGAGPGVGQVPAAAAAPAPQAAAPARPPGAALLDRFSEAEKEAIRGLQSLGNFPLPQVVHIYEACGKDAERAANLLFDM
jgi:UV excision repair protein RAD23